MHKVLVLFVLFSVIMVRCTKDTTPKNDAILHTDLQPPLEIESVDSLVFHSSGCGYVPFPADTMKNNALDINKDGIDDFTLTCKSWYQFVSASNPCANYNTSIVISGISDDNQIAVIGNYSEAKKYELDAVINNSQNWSNSATLKLGSAQAPISIDFNGNNYLGLKLKKGQNSHFCWLYLNKTNNTIKILAFAANLTEGNSIRVGQTE